MKTEKKIMPITGELRIRPRSVALIGLMKMFSSLEHPFLKITCGSKTLKSRIAEREEEADEVFTWWDCWLFRLRAETIITIQLYNKDVSCTDEFLGELEIDLKDVLDRKETKKWYSLKKQGRKSGKIMIQLNYISENNIKTKTNREFPQFTRQEDSGSMAIERRPASEIAMQTQNQRYSRQTTSNFFGGMNLTPPEYHKHRRIEFNPCLHPFNQSCRDQNYPSLFK